MTYIQLCLAVLRELLPDRRRGCLCGRCLEEILHELRAKREQSDHGD